LGLPKILKVGFEIVEEFPEIWRGRAFSFAHCSKIAFKVVTHPSLRRRQRAGNADVLTLPVPLTLEGKLRLELSVSDEES
jgi:hypothetical protein